MSFLALRPNLSRLQDLLSEPPESYDEALALTKPLRGSIELKNIYIRHHDQSQYVLEDVSLTIPAGKFVALVGPSGAGKSTLFKLILGLIHADAGVILIDNQPFTTLQPA